jgi:hypothetical protein
LAEHFAIVNWLRTFKNGELNLPHSLRYVGISRFDADGPQWPDGAYSVVCSFTEPPSEHGSPIEAKVAFLVEDAPHERLAAGVRFRLYEGPGEVAAEAASPPPHTLCVPF